MKIRRVEGQVVSQSLLERLPNEIKLEIFSYLGPRALGNCCLLNKQIKVVATDRKLLKEVLFRKIDVFGKKEWEKYLGDVGEEPLLPKKIVRMLQRPCPFWKNGAKVWETHTLTLMPKQAAGKNLDLTHYRKLIKSPKNGGNPSNYYEFDAGFYAKLPIRSSYWTLTASWIVPEGYPIPRGYSMPTSLEMVVSVTTQYTKTKLIDWNDNFKTQCHEMIEGKHLTVCWVKNKYMIPGGIYIDRVRGRGKPGILAIKKLLPD